MAMDPNQERAMKAFREFRQTYVKSEEEYQRSKYDELSEEDKILYRLGGFKTILDFRVNQLNKEISSLPKEDQGEE